MSFIRSLTAVASLVFLALAVAFCGGRSPADSTPPITTPPTTIAPSPTPTPSPGSSLPGSCALGSPPTGSLRDCSYRPSPILKDAIQSVQESVRDKGSYIFYEDGRTIRYMERYREEMVKGLDAQGICAIFDFGNGIGDVLYVRSADRSLNEAYDVVTSTGLPSVLYSNTCEPATPFPDFPPRFAVQDPECSLPASEATFCVGTSYPSLYADDVRASIVQVTEEKPGLFVFSDALSGELSYRLTDPEAYVTAVVANLRKRGYCAFEAEELSVKKDNSMNENFDIVRTPEGGTYSGFIYRGKCHDSLF